MADFISREAAYKTLTEYYHHSSGVQHTVLREALNRVPTADVWPVVRGKWISDGAGYHWTYNCSICGWKDGYPFNERHNFCPNCGCVMEDEK